MLNVARALHFQANLPIEFWGECVLTAAYLINRTPTPIFQNTTPYNMLFKESPSYAHIKVFGCLCYAHYNQKPKDKFDSRSRQCIFVGYPCAKKGWKVYDIATGEIFISRDVIFHKDKFSFHSNMIATGNRQFHSDILGRGGPPYDEGWTGEWPSAHARPDAPSQDTTASGNGSSADAGPLSRPSETGPVIALGQARMDGPSGPQPDLNHDVAHGTPDPVPPPVDRGSEDRLDDQGMGCGCREKKRPSHLKDYVCYSASSSNPSSTDSFQTVSLGKPYPLTH